MRLSLLVELLLFYFQANMMIAYWATLLSKVLIFFQAKEGILFFSFSHSSIIILEILVGAFKYT